MVTIGCHHLDKISDASPNLKANAMESDWDAAPK